jgi:hypothetical protein
MSFSYRFVNSWSPSRGNKNKIMSEFLLGRYLFIWVCPPREQIATAELVVENGAAMARHRH